MIFAFSLHIERSNVNFASMITQKILPECDSVIKTAAAFLVSAGTWSATFDDNYACWCGAGTKTFEMKKPLNVLDRICRSHDICYDRVHARCSAPYEWSYKWEMSNKKVKIKNPFLAFV